VAPQKKLHDVATDLVKQLVEAGFVAYFAGGFVRDILLGRESLEIDIATSAKPQQIMSLFPKTIAVGASFGVVVVLADGYQFEIATFRHESDYQDGRHPTVISYTSAEEDAKRRDFTINGMFYDPLTHKVYDFVGGQEDLKARIIRAIGSPQERFAEDRLRMIRAVRFAVVLGFRIEDNTAAAICAYASSLFPAVSMERIWQELMKMASSAYPDLAFIMLHRLGLLPVMFPDLATLTLHEIEQRVAVFRHYPRSCPSIFYVHAVVPEMGLQLCAYLKTSNRDLRLLETLLQIPKDTDPVAWALYYAKPDAWLCLEVFATHQSPGFLEKHQQQKQRLQRHVERIISKQPVVSAAILQHHGIEPGPKMGKLLRQAERIAIEQDLDDPFPILKQLQILS